VGAPARQHYPTKAAIKRAVEGARACGIDVAGVEVSPDGRVLILPLAAVDRKQAGGDASWAHLE